MSKASVTFTLPGQKNRCPSLKLFLLILTYAPTILLFPNFTSFSSTLGSKMLQSPISQSATQDLIPKILYDPILTTLDYILLLFFTKMIAFYSIILQSPKTISLFLSSQMIEHEGFIMHPSPNVTFPTISLWPRFITFAPPFFMLFTFNINDINIYYIQYSQQTILLAQKTFPKIQDRLQQLNQIQILKNQIKLYLFIISFIIQTQRTNIMIQHIKKLFLAMVAITCFTCFQRADYNLPLFAFAYFLWDYSQPHPQKTRLFYLFISTWVVDFIWLIYWGVTWSSNQYQNSGQSGSSTFVLTLSIITFIIKLAIILILFFMDPECKLAIRNFLHNTKSIISEKPVASEPAY